MVGHYDYDAKVAEAFSLWEIYHEEYVGIVPEYYDLLAQKKAKHIPLRRDVKEREIQKEFPKIPLLEAGTKSEVREILEEMSPVELDYVIGRIHNMVDNKASVFNRLRNAIVNSRRQLSRCNMSKTYAFPHGTTKF